MFRLIIIKIIKFYRFTIGPLLHNLGYSGCRFYPTCSIYAEESLQKHGVLVGLKLTTLRLIKCQPWHPGGVDLIP